MHALLRDVRYGIRSLLKAPGLTVVAMLALTLGIGLTTTMFSIVYGALMKGLPYPDGDRIIDRPARPTRARHSTAVGSRFRTTSTTRRSSELHRPRGVHVGHDLS